jgi:hypothetical protein
MPDEPLEQVANPGSTLGEAIGALIEREVNRILKPIAEENGYSYITAGRPNPRTGRSTLLKLTDVAGNEYRIDSVIANERMQPLVLVESKYIRYTKHNRDKGSWICTAHYSLRRTYPSIRKSIAIIAGSWSGTSKALMESFDVSLFEVGFPRLVEVLANYGVDITWKEKERDKVIRAWQRWQELSEDDYNEIARELLADIERQLREALAVTLDPAAPREITEIELTIETNLGESRRYTFSDIAEAIEFLNNFDEEIILNAEDSPSIFPAERAATGSLFGEGDN